MQSQTTRFTGLDRIEPHPVICHLQANQVFMLCQTDGDRPGVGMFEDVIESLLHDAVQAFFNLGRQ